MNDKYEDIKTKCPKLFWHCPNCYNFELYQIPKMRNGVHGLFCVNCEEIFYDEFLHHPSYNLSSGVNEK